MANSMQSKHDHWRSRPNGASPVFDPGLSPPGTNAEAGGAPATGSTSNEDVPRSPLPTSPKQGRVGFRAPPGLWYALAAVMAVLLLAAGLLSL